MMKFRIAEFHILIPKLLYTICYIPATCESPRGSYCGSTKVDGIRFHCCGSILPCDLCEFAMHNAMGSADLLFSGHDARRGCLRTRPRAVFLAVQRANDELPSAIGMVPNVWQIRSRSWRSN